MRIIYSIIVSLGLIGAAVAAPGNWGGGPGNSGPGDKNGQNEHGHGGQP